MELKELRNYIYKHTDEDGKRDLVIRIRNNNDKDGDIVYYNGIKAFYIKNNKIGICSNIFLLNEDFITNYKNELNNRRKRNIILKNMVDIRKKLINLGYLKIKENPKMKFYRSNAKSYQGRDEEIQNNKEKIINKIQEEFDRYNYTDQDVVLDCDCYNIKVNKNSIKLLNIEYIIMNWFINFSESEWKEPRGRLNGNYSGWRKPKLDIVESITKSISKIDEEKLESFIKNIKEVINEYLKISYEVEKNYQFQFMLSDDIKKKIKYEILKQTKKNLKYEDLRERDYSSIYAFEQEYFILNKKGRIDAIFFDVQNDNTADLYLIELKVNENVVGGDNGVHKHLSDIVKLNNHISLFKEELLRYLGYRRAELNESNITKINQVNFWTIIGITKDENSTYKVHYELSKKLLDAYKDNDENKLIEIKKEYHPKCNVDIPSKKESLEKYCSELECNKNKCNIKFFFDNWNNREIHDDVFGEYFITL